MSLKMTCPNPSCAKRYSIPDAGAGRSIRCKGCGETFVAGNSVTVNAAPANDGLEPAWDAAPARSSAPVPPPTTLGETVGRFAIRGKLGAGAFGTVYRAYDPQLDRVVALKVPNPGVMTDAKRGERFLREAKAAAGLRHPHIVPVFDAGQDGGRYYIASAFIDGAPLADAIPDGGTDFPRAARLARELAEALAYAHEQGVVHRDVKPQNVMVDKQDRVHLMDFGLASRLEEQARLTSDGAVMGTPSYMSPEQARGQQGEVQPATDQYAVGVVLYELLTGRTPFTGPTAVVLHNVIHTDPDSPRKFRASIPKDLETICLKAMAKRPEDRYANCQALADDLRRWQEGEPVTARPLRPWERLVRWVKKEPKVAGAVAVVAVVLMASVAVVSVAARRADAAAAQAEKDAIDARAAEKRAEDALAEAREAREGEKQAKGARFGALGTAAQERKKLEEEQRRAEALQELVREERKKSESFRAVVEEEQKNVATFQTQVLEERKNVEGLHAQLMFVAGSAIRSAYQLRNDEADLSPFGRVSAGAQAKSILQLVPPECRGWEWGHIQKLCDTPRNQSPVTAVTIQFNNFGVAALSPDGTQVLDGYASRDIFVIDTKRNTVVHTLKGHTREVYSATFSPDGTRIVTGSPGDGARVWDAKTGAELLTFRTPRNGFDTRG